MKIKTIFLFVCAVSACAVLQIGVYWQIAKAQSDSCPNYVATTSTPCPFPEGAVLYNDCSQSSNCTGYTSYSADTLNTGEEYQQGSESITRSTTYVSPEGYQCATYTMCTRHLVTLVCESRAKHAYGFGNLYTTDPCD